MGKYTVYRKESLSSSGGVVTRVPATSGSTGSKTTEGVSVEVEIDCYRPIATEDEASRPSVVQNAPAYT